MKRLLIAPVVLLVALACVGVGYSEWSMKVVVDGKVTVPQPKFSGSSWSATGDTPRGTVDTTLAEKQITVSISGMKPNKVHVYSIVCSVQNPGNISLTSSDFATDSFVGTPGASSWSGPTIESYSNGQLTVEVTHKGKDKGNDTPKAEFKILLK